MSENTGTTFMKLLETTSASGKTKYFNIELASGSVYRMSSKKAALALIDELKQTLSGGRHDIQSNLSEQQHFCIIQPSERAGSATATCAGHQSGCTYSPEAGENRGLGDRIGRFELSDSDLQGGFEKMANALQFGTQDEKENAELERARTKREAKFERARAKREAQAAEREAKFERARVELEAEFERARDEREAEFERARDEREAKLERARAELDDGPERARAEREAELERADAEKAKQQADQDAMYAKEDAEYELLAAESDEVWDAAKASIDKARNTLREIKAIDAALVEISKIKASNSERDNQAYSLEQETVDVTYTTI
jgi:DNA repair exonuclease SbcCD ATPase subunit